MRVNNLISSLSFTLLIYSSCIGQDTISSGFCKQLLPQIYDKTLLEQKCIEKARINAIENAFGFIVVDSSSLTKSHIRINDKEKSSSTLNTTTTTLVTGRWLKDESPPVIDYRDENGLGWIFVSVRGFVREIKPKSFNEDKEVMAEYMKELYRRSQFEGVKIVENNDVSFLTSLVALEKSKYKSYSDMNTVARVKSQSLASKFINGSVISSEDVIFTTSPDSSVESTTQIIASIRETSQGFINGMELLTTFDSKDGQFTIFIFTKTMSRNK
jgi:hypothetical protein